MRSFTSNPCMSSAVKGCGFMIRKGKPISMRTTTCLLWGIAIRRLIDQLRKRRPVPRDLGDLDVPPTSFEEELLASGAYGTVGDAVRDLDPDLQEVLVLTAVDGLSTRDAARLLDIPQGTVKTRLHRARRQLQSRLPHSGEPREDHR